MEKQSKYYLLWYEDEQSMRVYQSFGETWELMSFYGGEVFYFDDHSEAELWEEWQSETSYRSEKDSIDIVVLYANQRMLGALQKLWAEAQKQRIFIRQQWQLPRIKEFLAEQGLEVHRFQYVDDCAVRIELSNGEKLYTRRLDGRPFAADNSVQVEPQNVAANVPEFSAMDFQQVLQRMREEKQQRGINAARKERKHDDG